jgi:hypothetical protein
MKFFKLLLATFTLTFLLFETTMAGEMPTGGAVPPPTCPPGQTCVLSDNDIPSVRLTVSEAAQSDFVADPVAGTLLTLFGLF